MSHWSSGLTLCFPSQGTRVQIPWGVLKWNRDSPVSVVSLHWWPQHDWSSLWPHLRRASSRTITRPLCRQCDNPTWSHTAFLPRFHARCRSPFRLHNQRSRLLGGEPWGDPAISLHSHHVSLVQWSNPLLPVTRNLGSNLLGGYLSETRILLLALSRYRLVQYIYKARGTTYNSYIIILKAYLIKLVNLQTLVFSARHNERTNTC